jgi:hypothetical protein
VRLTAEWIKRAELKTGPLYRRIDPRSDAIGDKPMWSDVVADLVKELAEKTGLDPEKFSDKDQRVAMTYIRHGSLFRENAADGLEVEEEK